MEWINFPVFAGSTFLAWVTGLVMVYTSGKKKAIDMAGRLFIITGIIILAIFIFSLWKFENKLHSLFLSR